MDIVEFPLHGANHGDFGKCPAKETFKSVFYIDFQAIYKKELTLLDSFGKWNFTSLYLNLNSKHHFI